LTTDSAFHLAAVPGVLRFDVTKTGIAR